MIEEGSTQWLYADLSLHTCLKRGALNASPAGAPRPRSGGRCSPGPSGGRGQGPPPPEPFPSRSQALPSPYCLPGIAKQPKRDESR